MDYLLYRVCLTCFCDFFFYGDNMRLFKYMYNLLRYQPTEQSSWGQLALPVQEIPVATVLESCGILATWLLSALLSVCCCLSGKEATLSMGCGVPCVKGDPKGCVLSVRRPGRGQHTQAFVCTVQQHALKRKCAVLFFSGWCSDRTATSGSKQTELHLYHQPPETSNCLLGAPTQHQQK